MSSQCKNLCIGALGGRTLGTTRTLGRGCCLFFAPRRPGWAAAGSVGAVYFKAKYWKCAVSYVQTLNQRRFATRWVAVWFQVSTVLHHLVQPCQAYVLTLTGSIPAVALAVLHLQWHLAQCDSVGVSRRACNLRQFLRISTSVLLNLHRKPSDEFQTCNFVLIDEHKRTSDQKLRLSLADI
eukprot:5870366-Amphidinium_carterae.1